VKLTKEEKRVIRALRSARAMGLLALCAYGRAVHTRYVDATATDVEAVRTRAIECWNRANAAWRKAGGHAPKLLKRLGLSIGDARRMKL